MFFPSQKLLIDFVYKFDNISSVLCNFESRCRSQNCFVEIRRPIIANKLIASARGFSPEQLRRAVEMCAETDYLMKSSAGDQLELLKGLVLRIAAGEDHA